MKHLKKFEELSPSIYKSAAKELNKLGRASHGTGYHKVKPEDNDFKRRANSLDSWGDVIEWRKNIEELSKTSTKLPITVKSNQHSGSKKFNFTADFYLRFFFDRDCFTEVLDDAIEDGEVELTFSVTFIPADKESLEKCEVEGSDMLDEYTSMDMIWLAIKLKIEGNRITFDGLRISNDTEYGDVVLNRAIVGRIRTTLINMFTEGNSMSTGYTDTNDLYKMIENTVIIESGLSSEYGITMDYIKDELTKMTPNKMLSEYTK